MRLFTGIALSYEVRRNIEFLLEHARPLVPIQWSPIANLHITTKFIGDWPEDRLEELHHAIAACTKPVPFSLSIGGIGWLPNPHSPRIFFAGVRPLEAIGALATGIDAALAPLGVEQETRPFQPHLTLARIKAPGNLLPLKQFVASLPSTDFGAMTVAKFLLYRSQTLPSGSVYSVLREYSL